MGYNKHSLLIATTFGSASRPIFEAWREALPDEQKRLVVISPECMNGYWTVALLPDGSKEGWDTSDAFDALRDELAGLIREHMKYADMVHLTYGEDNGLTTIVQTTDLGVSVAKNAVDLERWQAVAGYTDADMAEVLKQFVRGGLPNARPGGDSEAMGRPRALALDEQIFGDVHALLTELTAARALLRDICYGAMHESCRHDDPAPTWHCCDWAEVVDRIDALLGDKVEGKKPERACAALAARRAEEAP